MKKILWLYVIAFAGLLLSSSIPAKAQGGFTTVIGTVTDPNGVAWACGTISAQLITAGGAAPTLNGGGFTTQTSPVSLGCPTTPGTGAAGSFTIRLADSGVISPSNTMWQFTVNINGGAPPLGTGPQSFTYTTAINCSTNTPATCTSNQINISTPISALAPKLASAGVGGVSPVSSLPGTCTSTSPLLRVVNNGTDYGTFSCSNGAYIPENPAQTISPYAYGAVGHVRYTYNAAWTNTSTTVTCSNGECNFQCPGGVYPCTNATSGCPSLTCDAGKIVKGSAMYPQVNSNSLNAAGIGNTLPQGTISTVTNATTITVSLAATNTCPTGALTTCTLSWGIQDDTTAIINAETAAWGNHNRCIALQLPADNFYITPPVFNGPQGTLKAGDVCSTLAAANGGSDLTNTGPSLYGAGEGTTTAIILSVTYASCTFGSGTSCMGTMPNLQARDFMITGLGDIGSGTQTHALWESIGSNAGGACDGGTTTSTMSFNNFGLNVSGLIGFLFGANSCADALQTNNSAVMFGSNPCKYNGSQVYTAFGLYCAGAGAGLANVFNATVPTGNQLNLYGGEYVFTLTAGNQVFKLTGGGKVNSNGNLYRHGDPQAAAQGSIILNNASFMDMTDDQVIMGTSAAANTFGYLDQNNGGILHSTNTTWNGNADASSTLFSTGATDKVFFDGTGNNITNAGLANSFSGPVFGISNTAAGTVCATGNFALTSGWGTSSVTSVATNGNIQGCHVTITGAAGSAGPVLTWTYPAAPIIAPPSCHLIGTTASLTGVQVGTPGATSVAFTFVGTPTAVTYQFDVGCP